MKTTDRLLLITLITLPALAQGQPPTAFGGWTANGGAISAVCPSGYTCEDNVNDRGILQRILTDPSGKRFIQLVIHDAGPQGTLSVESFVDASENANRDGIAIRQILDAPTDQGRLNATATIYTGWAIDPSAPALQLQQSLVQNDPANQDFNNTFLYEVDRDGNDNRLGHYLDIRVDVITPNNAGTTNQDTVVIREAGGSRVAQSGSVTLPRRGGMGGMGGMGGGGRGGSLSWQAGDSLQTIWVAQQCQGCSSGGMGGGGMGGGGGGGLTLFSYQAFDDLSDSAGAINSYSLSDTAPLAWPDPPLGPAPAFQ